MATSQDQIEKLSEIFMALGAADPKALARSQIEEGIPQLPAYLFLKSAIGIIQALSDARSLREMLRQSGCPDALSALNRLNERREMTRDILLVVRSALCTYLDELSFVIDDTAGLRFSGCAFESVLNRIHWGLFEVDDKGNPIGSLCGLHEVVRDVISQHLNPNCSSTEETGET